MKDEPEGSTPTDLRERTFAFALSVVRLFRHTRGNVNERALARQFLRSGTSVGAHYREAARARSNAEFISKMEGGLQELDETVYWIQLLAAAEVLPSAATRPMLTEADALIRIFVTCVRNAKAR
jgi:four helix bundle protein